MDRYTNFLHKCILYLSICISKYFGLQRTHMDKSIDSNTLFAATGLNCHLNKRQ